MIKEYTEKKLIKLALKKLKLYTEKEYNDLKKYGLEAVKNKELTIEKLRDKNEECEIEINSLEIYQDDLIGKIDILKKMVGYNINY